MEKPRRTDYDLVPESEVPDPAVEVDHRGRRSNTRTRFVPRILALLAIGLVVYLFIGPLISLSSLSIDYIPCLGHLKSNSTPGRHGLASDNGMPSQKPQVAVPLEAHVMSKCPDAQACLQKLVVPTMEHISDKVDFELSFIAR